MKVYVVSKPAAADLRAVRDWIAKDDPVRAVSYLEELNLLFARLADSPMMGRRREAFGPDVRSFVSGNYVVFYRQADAGISISRVIHARRDIERAMREP